MRLQSPSEFRRVFRRGHRGRTGCVEMCWLCADDAKRLGVVVSKAVGNAVVRNRFKRVVREWFRNQRNTLASGDFVIRAFAKARETPTRVIWDDLTMLAQSVRKRA